jgi:hypothetical protein
VIRRIIYPNTQSGMLCITFVSSCSVVCETFGGRFFRVSGLCWGKIFLGVFQTRNIINPRTCVEFNIKFLSGDDGGAGAGWKIQIDYE